MPELNREEIIKALECCTNWNPKTACKGCPCESEVTCRNLKKDALTLIKQLTEENESLGIENEVQRLNLGNTRDDLNNAECDVKRLMREKTALECEVIAKIATTKTEVAREIFEDFSKHKVCTNEEDFRVLADLKKKYIGETE